MRNAAYNADRASKLFSRVRDSRKNNESRPRQYPAASLLPISKTALQDVQEQRAYQIIAKNNVA